MILPIPAPTHKVVNLTRTRINYASVHAISSKPVLPLGVSQPFHILGRSALIGVCRQIENPQIAITSPKNKFGA